MLTNNKAIEKLQQLIETIPRLKQQRRFPPDFEKWKRDARVAIENIFSPNVSHAEEFSKIKYGLSAFTLGTPDYEFDRAYHRGLDAAKAMLESMIDEIREYRQDMPATPPRNTVEVLDRLCSGFHRVVIQLRDRYSGRSTIDVDDEYDVQDLLHALLLIDFRDVRKEEWTPSYAGGSARVDFLLKQEQTVIEVKKTRRGLGARELGDQLLIDIGRYQAHPECKSLYCFVYDPENRITNPRGLENDLSKLHGDLSVKLLIAPS